MATTWRKCDSAVCGVKTAHTRTYDDNGAWCARCENCGKLTPVRPRKAKATNPAIERLFEALSK